MEEGRGGERRSAAACTTACKNDRALTRYKSHYDVNLLDPSPPTDFQPPGTVLGYGLWATSHANSDEVAPSLSLSLHLSISPSARPLFLLCSQLSSPLSSTAHPSLSISLFPSLWFYPETYPHPLPQGRPQPPRTGAREYLSPGHLRAD